MWYRAGKSEEDNIPTAKPWDWLNHRKKKRKVKRFDFQDDGAMPIQNADDAPNITPINQSPLPSLHAPTNVVETPDLPAGVVETPQAPIHKPLPPDLPMENKHHHRPKQLDDLYGPDTDMKDDHIINTPNQSQNEINPELEQLEPEEQEIQPEEQDEPELELEPQLDQSNQPVPDPPVHEFCHCKVETMPGGRRIWRANEGACNDCLRARDTFNHWQASIFGS